MKFEVIEDAGAWIVRQDGVELARYSEQTGALEDVAARLRDGEPGEASYSLAMRYQPRR